VTRCERQLRSLQKPYGQEPSFVFRFPPARVREARITYIAQRSPSSMLKNVGDRSGNHKRRLDSNMSSTQPQPEKDQYMHMYLEGSCLSHYTEVPDTDLPSVLSNCPLGTAQIETIWQLPQESNPQYDNKFMEDLQDISIHYIFRDRLSLMTT
jgi:hypothetical protein